MPLLSFFDQISYIDHPKDIFYDLYKHCSFLKMLNLMQHIPIQLR